MGGLVVEPPQILWHRLRVNNLAHRLPPKSFTAAAFAGLQDAAPRAALTALYSRVEDVSSTAWEHPTLVQTSAPCGAVFVVPRRDLAVFALGIVPRTLNCGARLSSSPPRRATPWSRLATTRDEPWLLLVARLPGLGPRHVAVAVGRRGRPRAGRHAA